MTRHMRLTQGAALEQRQREMSKTCDVPGCGRTRVVLAHLPGGMVRMRRWCDRHRYATRRPLDTRKTPTPTPIPASMKKIYLCSIFECGQWAEIERATRLIDDVPTAGWQVRSFCRRHRNPELRPVGWVPLRGDKTVNSYRQTIKRFLGVNRWADRGYFDGTMYRLQVGRLLYTVDALAIDAMRVVCTDPWKDRETLGAFAARYNLAVVAVVGATLAMMEYEGNGQT